MQCASQIAGSLDATPSQSEKILSLQASIGSSHHSDKKKGSSTQLEMFGRVRLGPLRVIASVPFVNSLASWVITGPLVPFLLSQKAPRSPQPLVGAFNESDMDSLGGNSSPLPQEDALSADTGRVAAVPANLAVRILFLVELESPTLLMPVDPVSAMFVLIFSSLNHRLI